MLAHLQQLFETQTALMEEHLTVMKSKNAFLADEYNRSMNDLGSTARL